ncbi:hypothetical protein [Polaribacter aestuariivivens]|uniref:hypothetical protein n=1 Tax=Polaribacter aestuariivivens TaxID=2304626 RepID=UPI003F495E4F
MKAQEGASFEVPVTYKLGRKLDENGKSVLDVPRTWTYVGGRGFSNCLSFLEIATNVKKGIGKENVLHSIIITNNSNLPISLNVAWNSETAGRISISPGKKRRYTSNQSETGYRKATISKVNFTVTNSSIGRHTSRYLKCSDTAGSIMSEIKQKEGIEESLRELRAELNTLGSLENDLLRKKQIYQQLNKLEKTSKYNRNIDSIDDQLQKIKDKDSEVSFIKQKINRLNNSKSDLLEKKELYKKLNSLEKTDKYNSFIQDLNKEIETIENKSKIEDYKNKINYLSDSPNDLLEKRRLYQKLKEIDKSRSYDYEISSLDKKINSKTKNPQVESLRNELSSLNNSKEDLEKKIKILYKLKRIDTQNDYQYEIEYVSNQLDVFYKREAEDRIQKRKEEEAKKERNRTYNQNRYKAGNLLNDLKNTKYDYKKRKAILKELSKYEGYLSASQKRNLAKEKQVNNLTGAFVGLASIKLNEERLFIRNIKGKIKNNVFNSWQLGAELGLVWKYFYFSSYIHGIGSSFSGSELNEDDRYVTNDNIESYGFGLEVAMGLRFDILDTFAVSPYVLGEVGTGSKSISSSGYGFGVQFEYSRVSLGFEYINSTYTLNDSGVGKPDVILKGNPNISNIGYLSISLAYLLEKH